ncbi:MAG: lyase family protein, partial [Spirochaetota bacterium]
LAASYELVNRSALGAAASFGVPLPLDREMVARELGFAGIHHNVLAAVSSRGQLELALLDALDQAGVVLSRFATDLIIFTLPEFGYFSLPPELCSGSSIMPQKRNPDGLELLRGKSGVLSAAADQVRNIVRSLPAAYNRDVQETKEPLLRSLDLAGDMLAVAALTIERLEVHEERLRAAFTPEIFATDAAIDRVEAGESFRDAYRAVAAEIGSLVTESFDLDAVIARRSATGAPGNLDLGATRAALDEMRSSLDREAERVRTAVATLAGRELPLYPGLPADR